MHHRTLSDRILDGANYFILLILAITMFIPFLYIFSVSFSTFQSFYLHEGFLLWPTDWSIEAYKYILESDAFVRSIFVTIFYAVVGTLVHVGLSAMMAYALTRGIRGQKTVLVLILISLLFGAPMIPSYLVVKMTGLMNSIWALIIPGAIGPMTVIMLRQFFLSIPKDLNEAAYIDGANEWDIFRYIILPLSKPALAAFGLFSAVGYWNSYFSAILYINDPFWWPLQVMLRQLVVLSDQGALGSAYTQNAAIVNPPPPETIGMAAILVTTIPILLVYPFLQKHFAKGVMLGSIKG